MNAKENPSRKPAKIGLVLTLTGAILLLLCGGVVGLLFFGFKSGMDAANREVPYMEGVLSRMSKARYEIERCDDLEPRLKTGAMGEQSKFILSLVAKRLGKFERVRNVTGFNTKWLNGRIFRTIGAETEFEKAMATVTMTFAEANGQRSVTDIRFNSPALDRDEN